MRAAALRRLQAETATLLGEEFVYLLWDGEKFYHYVDLGLLLEASLACGVNKRGLILSLQVLLALREIRVGKVSGSATVPHNDMLAGLRRSMFSARLLLYKTLETMHKVIPQARPRQYVDDLAQLIHGDRKYVIENASVGDWMLIETLRRSR